MRIHFRTAALAATAALLAAIFTGSGPVNAQSAQPLSIQAGHSLLLETPGLERVATGDSNVIGVLPIGTSQLVVNAKAPGRTNLVVWESGRRVVYEVIVTALGLNQLAQMLRAAIPDRTVQIVSFNSSIVLRGTVLDGQHFQQVSDVLSRFDKYIIAQKYTIVNAIMIAHPLGDLQHDLSGVAGAAGIRVDPDGKGNVIVSGRVHDAVTAQLILERVLGLAGPYLASDGKLINRISTDTHTQIDIKVDVIEVDQTAIGNIGLQLQSIGATGTVGPPIFPIFEQGPTGLGGALKIGAFIRSVMLAPTLNLLIQEGHAKNISSPDLLTLPGNTATFLVGGQIPIPISSGLGAVSIQYEQFGVQLNVTPTLLGDGSVQALIAPDISSLDFANGVSLNGFVVPALRESKISTSLIVHPGQSIVMGGLVQHLENRVISKIPLLSSLPIIGKLFQSTSYQNSQSDVIFVLTPYVITK